MVLFMMRSFLSVEMSFHSIRHFPSHSHAGSAAGKASRRSGLVENVQASSPSPAEPEGLGIHVADGLEAGGIAVYTLVHMWHISQNKRDLH